MANVAGALNRAKKVRTAYERLAKQLDADIDRMPYGDDRHAKYLRRLDYIAMAGELDRIIDYLEEED